MAASAAQQAQAEADHAQAGEALQGQLCMTVVGHSRSNIMAWYWPICGALVLVGAALVLVCAWKRANGKQNFLLLVVGMFMETIAALIILFPALIGVATGVGIDPVHFATFAVLSSPFLMFCTSLSKKCMAPDMAATAAPVAGSSAMPMSGANMRVWNFALWFTPPRQ